MEWKIVDTSRSGQKTYVIVMHTGDEAMSLLRELARSEGLRTCQFTAIGAFSKAVLGYFDFSIKDYRKITVPGQREVLSLAGDIAGSSAQLKVHAHAVLGGEQGETRGGHLLEGHVHPTLEVILTESPVYLSRAYDPESGLALLDLSS